MFPIQQDVYFFFDDSGVLHKKEPSRHFVYAGYVFTSKKEMEEAKRKYIHANKAIRKVLGRNDELKASNLKPKHRRSLYNVVSSFETVSGIVNIDRIYDHILSDKKSICRYKDYVLKRCIKAKLEELIRKGKLTHDDDINIQIFIDEQLTATNGYYALHDSIVEELQYGVNNFDYGTYHPPVFQSNVNAVIKYCDSSKYYLIQASDILANRIWNSYKNNDVRLRTKKAHLTLTFP